MPSRAQPEPHALASSRRAKLAGRPSARDAAVVEVEHVIRNSLEVMDPMLCHERGDPFGLPARDGRAKLRDRLEVEVGRRFVQHDECGRCRCGARARHALLLTARKRKEALVDQGRKVELPCRSIHLPFDVGGLESQILAPEGDFPSDVDAIELGFGVSERRCRRVVRSPRAPHAQYRGRTHARCRFLLLRRNAGRGRSRGV